MSAAIISGFSNFSKYPVSDIFRKGADASYVCDNGLALVRFSALTATPFDKSGRAAEIGNGADAARGLRDLLDALCVIFNIVSLQFLFEREDDGSFKLVNGVKRVYQHTCDIIGSIVLLACRALNIGMWLHKLKAVDLGKHFSRMGYAIMAGFTTLCVLDIAKAVDKACKSRLEKQGAKAQLIAQRNANAEIGRAFVNMASCVVSEFGYYPKTPAGTVAAGVIGMAAATWNLVSLAPAPKVALAA
jgi:hypothetical protein